MMDTRAMFEEWYRNTYKISCRGIDKFEIDTFGDYVDAGMFIGWAAFQAAISHAKEQGEPVAWIHHFKKFKGGCTYRAASLNESFISAQDNGYEYVKTELLFSSPQPAQDGWVLVPIDPTYDMTGAGKDAHFKAEEEAAAAYGPNLTTGMHYRKNRAAAVYKAMIAAAPKQDNKS